MARPRLVLLTPRGVAGVAVVAIAATDRTGFLAQVLRRPDGSAWSVSATSADAAVPRLALLQLDGVAVDQVVVVERADRTELCLHGAPAVLDALADRCELVGPSPAADRVERLLRSARSDAQLALALEQRGAETLAELCARLRRLGAPARRREARAALARSRVAQALAEPCRLVLFGAQNAGKSTLLNRLAFAPRALVGDLPGLTRDPVVEPIELCGYPYLATDTAGEGDAAGELDRAAIERGRAERRGGLAVLVVDGTRSPTLAEREWWQHADLRVRTKADLPGAGWPADLVPDAVVGCAGEGSAVAVRAALGAALRRQRGLPPAPPDGVGGAVAWDADGCAELAALADEPGPAAAS
ncbi:MAG: 50S ribosome-binding GTPase [Planctomycetes bacterium]|nr:50S ribosome-binding GTPase [Planctomycetota bacterium]